MHPAKTSLLGRPFGCSLTALVVLAVTPSLSAAPDGAALFEKYCIPCHGPDGRARTPVARKLGVKDLTQSRIDDLTIAIRIAEGSKDTRGKERMPPFKDKVDAPEIEALVAFVKSLRK